jgi:uncharacterized repeat protein (TIGR01451 family)/LPXTG-motif cell wall-anchored protein
VEYADPGITKQVNVQEAHVGDIVIYTLTIRNHGNLAAQDVVVHDPLPSFLAVVDVNATRGQIGIDGSNVSVTLGTVTPGEVITIQITARVVTGVLPPNNRNVARLTTSSGGQDTSNDIDAAGFVILPAQPSASPTASPMPESPPTLVATTPPSVPTPAQVPPTVAPTSAPIMQAPESQPPQAAKPAAVAGGTPNQTMLPQTGHSSMVLPAILALSAAVVALGLWLAKRGQPLHSRHKVR